MLSPLLIVALVVLLKPAAVGWVLSKSINVVLQWTYPTRTRHDGSNIPGLPFEWANGQGTEKFFHGHSAAQRWRASMGSIYRIWSGFRPEVVLTQPAQVRPYFRTSNHHVKAADNNSGWLFGEVLGSCVGLVSGSRWQALRSEMEPFFTRAAATAHTTTIVDAAREFIPTQLPVAKRNDAEASITLVNPARDLQFFPFFVVAGLLFGEPLSDEQKVALRDLAPLREELFREVIRGGINRWGMLARWFGSRGAKMLVQFQTRWSQFVEDSYRHAKQSQSNKEKDGPSDGATAGTGPASHRTEIPIVSLWEAVLQGRISRRECLQSLDESLYANLDVTTNAISWTIVLIAQHASAQTELRDEICNVQRSDAAAWARYIDRSDTFLAACVIESARLHPILPFSNPEASPTEDLLVDGYSIPKKTNVVIDSHAINVANPFWVNGEVFDPQRHFRVRKQAARYNLWRFGFGPRQCLGKHFADRMLRSLLAEMVARYALTISGGEDAGSAEERGANVKVQNESWVGLPDVVVRCVKL